MDWVSNMVFPTVMSKEDSLPPYLLAQTENNRKLTNTGMSTRNPSCGPGCRTETWRKHFVKTTTGQPSRVPSLLRSFVLSLCYHSINCSTNLALLSTTLVYLFILWSGVTKNRGHWRRKENPPTQAQPTGEHMQPTQGTPLEHVVMVTRGDHTTGYQRLSST